MPRISLSEIVNQDIRNLPNRDATNPLPKLKPPKPSRKNRMAPTPMTKTKTAPRISVPKAPGRKATAEKPNDLGFKVIKLKSDDWVFTQLTAVSSCNIVDKYHIPEHMTKYINHNHNAWSNETLYKYYKTFVGAHNYYNHQQDYRKSFGFVADATIREILLPETNEKIYYVDLLVATNSVEPYDSAIVSRLANGQITTWSVGCVSTSLQCSRCGHVSEDPKNDCAHMTYELGRRFLTPFGDISETAAIVVPFFTDGRLGKVEFTEISMVDDPAFPGAVSGYRINVPKANEVFFRIPNVAWTRKNQNANGVIHWHKKGYIEVVG